MTFCETATWAHRSSVAHLVSLHSSYSHRTLREGVRSLSSKEHAIDTGKHCRPARTAHPVSNKCFIIHSCIQKIISLIILLDPVPLFFV
jgi:hypothetical protein